MIRQLVSCVCVLSLVSGSAALAAPYAIQDIGPANLAGTPRSFALNDSGQVVGSVTVAGNTNAFYWSPTSGGEVNLNSSLSGTTPVSSQAWGINDAGQICGAYTDTTGESYAFVYSAGTGATDLGAFGPKSTGAVGDAINSAGQIAVTYLQTVGVGFYQDTAIVSSSGTVQATLPQGQGYVYGIDANGDAVGFTLLETPWYYSLSSNTVTDLPVPSGSTEDKAFFVSDNGLLVAGQNFNIKHALLWTNGASSSLPTDLGTLGGSTSNAFGVNDAGTVVGTSATTAGVNDAFVYAGGTMIDLNKAGVVANLAGSGFSSLNYASAVNAEGQIVGLGNKGGGTGTEAFLLTPYLSGDANLDGRVDINDLTVVLARYGQTGMGWAQGEFTGSGTVDINDLTIVLANYGRSENYGSSAAGLAAVPEPASLGLLTAAMAGAAFLFWRRQG